MSQFCLAEIKLSATSFLAASAPVSPLHEAFPLAPLGAQAIGAMAGNPPGPGEDGAGGNIGVGGDFFQRWDNNRHLIEFIKALLELLFEALIMFYYAYNRRA